MTAIEYLTVAYAFANLNLYDEVFGLLDRALTVKRDQNEHVTALRLYGGTLLLSKNVERGREMYQRALDFTNEYPGLEPGFVEWINMQTYLHWSVAESAAYECQAALDRLERAAALAAPWTGNGWEQLKAQVEERRNSLCGCNTPQAPRQ